MPSRIFRLTSWSEQSTPAELSIASVLIRPPRPVVLDSPLLREAEVPALGDDAGANLGAVDPDRVVRAVAHVRVRLVGRLDERPDAAVPEEVDGRLQDRCDHLVRRSRLDLRPQRRASLRRERDRLLLPRPDAAAGREQRAVVVVPGRARELEETPALRERGLRIGPRVDEHVAMVERADEQERVRVQHAVAEDVPGHVADSDHRERSCRDIVAELAEVTFHGLPGATRGDAELLVVVALRSA